MQTGLPYGDAVYKARYFWWHLAMSDMRARWRRSYLGLLWSAIQPLGMTLLLSYVFSRIFHGDIATLIPYILSGIIVWDCISTSIMNGATAFVQAEPYIKQTRHPLAIYTLRIVIGNLVNLSVAFIGLYLCTAFIFPEKISLLWLVPFSVIPILLLVLWPLATLMAYISTRFRDVPHLMGLVLQTIWFISPVYFEERLFRQGGLDALVDYNPIYHVLKIVRAPLIDGTLPALENYGMCLLSAALFACVTILVGRQFEKKVIFYL